jgi:hypothetical protein
MARVDIYAGLYRRFMVPVEWVGFRWWHGHVQAHRWLQFTANLGQATNTVDGKQLLQDRTLEICERARLRYAGGHETRPSGPTLSSECSMMRTATQSTSSRLVSRLAIAATARA